MKTRHLPINYTVCTADTIVCNEPCDLYGVIILCMALGGDATIYNGRDAKGGNKVAKIQGPADRSWQIPMPHPVHLDRGLFVDVGTDVYEITVFWKRCEKEE